MDQILLNGNQAVALGAFTAGWNFTSATRYRPPRPYSCGWKQNLVGPGKFCYQASSEIEAINAIVGAGFSGKKAMTATAGPGFSLMSEGLGLAWMAEIPVVVADIQRGGPATGLPTKTEQSDLMAAMFPAHGDVKLPIIAPGTVEECFYAAIHAVNWAERYQGPVMLLSEHALSERNQNIPKPRPRARCGWKAERSMKARTATTATTAGSFRQCPYPGKPGSYVANGSEHDGMGDTTHLPQRHIQMTNRRFSKIRAAAKTATTRATTPTPTSPCCRGAAPRARRSPHTANWRRTGHDLGLVLHHVPQPAAARSCSRN